MDEYGEFVAPPAVGVAVVVCPFFYFVAAHVLVAVYACWEWWVFAVVEPLVYVFSGLCSAGCSGVAAFDVVGDVVDAFGDLASYSHADGECCDADDDEGDEEDCCAVDVVSCFYG